MSGDRLRLLDDETYDRVLKAQGGRCGICSCAPRTQRLRADHDHDTGVFRGLLCNSCNHKLLGGAHDQVALLQAAIAYLTDPPAPKTVGLVLITGRKHPRV